MKTWLFLEPTCKQVKKFCYSLDVGLGDVIREYCAETCGFCSPSTFYFLGEEYN